MKHSEFMEQQADDHMERKAETAVNPRKGAIIGCGLVGAACAFALMESGLFSELVLIDVDRERAEGEAMDIGHGVPFAKPVRIFAGDYADVSDAAVIVITAGANQKPDETRLDLVHKNIRIYESIIPRITAQTFGGILLVVSNPVDVLTYVTAKLSGYEKRRIIGSGTVLDTARLKYAVAKHLNVDSRSVHAFIVGEHGDSEIAAWSCANISGIPLQDFCELSGYYAHAENTARIAAEVRNSAYEIIEKKQATYFGIAVSVRRICEVILRDEKSILPVSVLLDGVYGISDVALSVPAVVGKYGVERCVPIPLSDAELEKLRASAVMLRSILAEADM